MYSSKTHAIEHTVQVRLVSENKRRGHIVRAVQVTASTPALAARMAEMMPEFRALGGRAISVTTTRQIECRCGRCQAIVFSGELTRLRDGQPRCHDCA